MGAGQLGLHLNTIIVRRLQGLLWGSGEASDAGFHSGVLMESRPAPGCRPPVPKRRGMGRYRDVDLMNGTEFERWQSGGGVGGRARRKKRGLICLLVFSACKTPASSIFLNPSDVKGCFK